MIRRRRHRPPSGVSSRHAHTGTYSMKLTINTESGTAGCRQNRDVEARSGDTFVYSAWYYLPRREVPIREHAECLSVQVGLAFRCLDRDGSFLDNQHRAKPTRVPTPTRVEVEGRTHGITLKACPALSPIRRYRRESTVSAAWLSRFGGGSRSARTSSSLETSLGVWPCARTASCSGTCGMFARSIRMEGRAGASQITRTAFETTRRRSSSTTRTVARP